MTNTEEPRHRDGNALAGTYAGMLGLDLTSALITCAGCGRTERFAQSPVYDGGPGVVVRCAQCDGILARVVHGPSDLWVDLQGSTSWRIPLPAEA